MIPPIIRDHLKPREKQHYFDIAIFRLANGYTVTVERSVSTGEWWLILSRAPTGIYQIANDPNDRTDHHLDGEFEAQCLLDHYVQTYGLLEGVAA